MSLAYPVDDYRFYTASPLTQLWIRGQGLARGIGATRYTVSDAPDEFNDYEMYDSPDWDGYGAAPITHETVEAARGFKRLLPMDAPQPDIAPGGDGTIGFEWRSGSPDKRSLILVDVGPGDLVTARRVDETGRIWTLQPTRVGTGAHALVIQLFS